MNKKILVFDLDGTLINSDECIFLTWKEMFSNFPPEIEVDDCTIKSFSGPPLLDTVKLLYSHGNILKMNQEYIERTKKYYDNHIYLFNEEIKYLKLLKEKGFKLAINTNKNRERTLYTLNLFNMLDLFDFLVCGSDVQRQKPDPEGINKIINFFECEKEEVLFIGDTKFDYDTAINSNVDCVLFTMCERKFEPYIKPLKFFNSYEEFFNFLTK